MRTVIYDAEDMEPITVIDVPGQYLREIEEGKRGRVLQFMAMPPLSVADFSASEESSFQTMKSNIVTISFEPIFKGNTRKPMMWLATTMDGETALLLRAAFLPGQRAEVQRERREAFMGGLMAAFGGPFTR